MAAKTLKIRTPGKAKSTLDRVHRHRAEGRDCKYGAPENLKRRRRYEKDTARWLKYYLADAFPLPWSETHRRYISDLDYIAKYGGWKAEALPRGSGKTTIAEGASLKYLVTGVSRYLVLLSAKATMAKESASDIKTWLLTNERLAADYPEICAPIAHTKGIPQAMSTVTANGEPVNMKWTAGQIVLPDCPLIMPGGKKERAKSSGAVIQCEGITGAMRGMKHATTAGDIIRPDMVIADDPQTPESARSPEQTRVRIQIIKSDVAGLAGPGSSVRIVVPCTIIEPEDLADQITDPDREPDFLGERQPFFLSMPKNMELWEEYNEVRKEGLARRDMGRMARDFYLSRKKELTDGAEVSWLARKGDHSVDGIQWGMDQYFRLGPRAFATELQNSPLPKEDVIELTKKDVLNCEVKIKKHIIQDNSVCVTCFIDCNPGTSGLWYSIVSFDENTRARVVAYGNYPGRRKPIYSKNCSEAEAAGKLQEALRKLIEQIKNIKLKCENGKEAKINLLLIDAGYKFNIIVDFVKNYNIKGPFDIKPSRGRNFQYFNQFTRGVIRRQENIYEKKNPDGNKILHHNADVLREMAQRAFLAGKEQIGGIAIHAKPPVHDEFAESIISEKLVDKHEGKTGPMYKWNLTPGVGNDYLDCIVGCYAGAHWLGMKISTASFSNTKKKRRLKIRKNRI